MRFIITVIFITAFLTDFSQDKVIYKPNVTWAYESRNTIELKNIKPSYFPIDSTLKDKMTRGKLQAYAYSEKKKEFIESTEEVKRIYETEKDTDQYQTYRIGHNLLYIKQLFYFDEKRNSLEAKIEAAAPVFQTNAWDDSIYNCPIFYTSVEPKNIKIKNKDFVARIDNVYSFNVKEYHVKEMFTKTLDDILMDKLYKGELSVYGLFGKKLLTRNQIKDSMGYYCADSIYVTDPGTNIQRLKPLAVETSCYKIQIVGYKIIQNIYFNKRKNIFYTKILALCPLYKADIYFDVADKDKIYSLFWIPFNGFDVNEIKME